ncbi:MAG: hypothetical protein U0R17_03605 [Acidimicrobiia bacterium]
MKFEVDEIIDKKGNDAFELCFEQSDQRWSIPKGLPLKPKSKTLAYMVDRNLFDNLASTSERKVWDEGTINLLPNYAISEPEYEIDDAIKKGFLRFEAEGDKVHSAFSLIRSPKFGNNIWYITNVGYENTSYGGFARPKARRNKSTDELVEKPIQRLFHPIHQVDIEDIDEWFFEPKLDGKRILISVKGKEVTVIDSHGESRKRLNKQHKTSLMQFNRNAVIEAVLINEQRSKPNTGKTSKKTKPNLIVTDILEYDQIDLTSEPIEYRKKLLKKVTPTNQYVDVVPFYEFSKANQERPESIRLDIDGKVEKNPYIIAKKKSSTYTNESNPWIILPTAFLVGVGAKVEFKKVDEDNLKPESNVDLDLQQNTVDISAAPISAVAFAPAAVSLQDNQLQHDRQQKEPYFIDPHYFQPPELPTRQNVTRPTFETARKIDRQFLSPATDTELAREPDISYQKETYNKAPEPIDEVFAAPEVPNPIETRKTPIGPDDKEFIGDPNLEPEYALNVVSPRRSTYQYQDPLGGADVEVEDNTSGSESGSGESQVFSQQIQANELDPYLNTVSIVDQENRLLLRQDIQNRILLLRKQIIDGKKTVVNSIDSMLKTEDIDEETKLQLKTLAYEVSTECDNATDSLTYMYSVREIKESNREKISKRVSDAVNKSKHATKCLHEAKLFVNEIENKLNPIENLAIAKDPAHI